MSTTGGITLEQSISMPANSGLYGSPRWFDDGPGSGNDRTFDVAAMRGQIACTGDGAVWFRLIRGNIYSMNRWSDADGLVSVSSPNAWEVGANTVPVGDNAVISTAGGIQAQLGDIAGRGTGPSTIRYSFDGTNIQSEWNHVYYDMNFMDDFCFWALDGDYVDGTLVNGLGTGRSGECNQETASLIRIYDKEREVPLAEQT